MVNGHDIPVFSFFENKNIYTGSDGQSFRFRIAKNDDALEACVWNEDICYELCTVTAKESFSFDQSGLEKAVDWIFEQKDK